MDTLNVTAAIIEHNYRYLILRRAPRKTNAGLWEFPGGKLKAGESLQDAVAREIQEELGVTAKPGRLLASVSTRTEDKVLNLFAVEVVLEKMPTKSIDHSEMRWVTYE